MFILNKLYEFVPSSSQTQERKKEKKRKRKRKNWNVIWLQKKCCGTEIWQGFGLFVYMTSLLASSAFFVSVFLSILFLVYDVPLLHIPGSLCSTLLKKFILISKNALEVHSFNIEDHIYLLSKWCSFYFLCDKGVSYCILMVYF